MIVFKFDAETHCEGIPYSRILYWLGTIDIQGEDKKHTAEIYEQLDAQACGLADETLPLPEVSFQSVDCGDKRCCVIHEL